MKQGWEIKKLGEVCKTSSGGTPLKIHKEYYENGDIPWLLSGEVNQREISYATNFITEKGLDNSSAKIFPKNTVLIAMYGATAGQVGILNFEACTNQAVCGILPNDIFNHTFLFYFFKHIQENLKSQAIGGAQPNISQDKIKKVEIPIPPIAEQERIVGILDSAFAKIEALRANAQQNLKNTKELFQASLKQELSPKQGWEQSTLKDECYKITDGTHQTPKYFDSGVIFLSSRNVTSGKINWTNIKFIDQIQHNEMHKRVAPQVNDILLAKNGTTGVAAIVDKDVIFDIYVSLALLRTIGNITPQYMLYYVNSTLAKEQFNKRLKGSGVPNLHLEEIRQVRICFPKNCVEQQAIVLKLDSLSDHCRAMEENYRQTIAHCNALKQALLTKAFNGEL